MITTFLADVAPGGCQAAELSLGAPGLLGLGICLLAGAFFLLTARSRARDR